MNYYYYYEHQGLYLRVTTKRIIYSSLPVYIWLWTAVCVFSWLGIRYRIVICVTGNLHSDWGPGDNQRLLCGSQLGVHPHHTDTITHRWVTGWHRWKGLRKQSWYCLAMYGPRRGHLLCGPYWGCAGGTGQFLLYVFLTHWSRVAWPAPSHYLNQCWNIVNWAPRNTLQWNFNQNSCIFIQENPFLKISSGKWRPFCLGLSVLKANIPQPMVYLSWFLGWNWLNQRRMGP